MTKIFVGYDNREDMAYRVCHSSILKNSPHLKSSDIIPLKHQSLRDDKKFWRTWRIDEDGRTKIKCGGCADAEKCVCVECLETEAKHHICVEENDYYCDECVEDEKVKIYECCECGFTYNINNKEMFIIEEENDENDEIVVCEGCINK